MLRKKWRRCWKNSDPFVNEGKVEEFEIPKPPLPPPPSPLMKISIKHKHWKVLRLKLNWFVNYQAQETTPNWKKCKLLGSLLWTDEDIKWRKWLALDFIHKQVYIFKSKELSIPLREKCRNTEFFLVRIFPHSDWMQGDKNTDQKKICIWALFAKCSS